MVYPANEYPGFVFSAVSALKIYRGAAESAERKIQ
jgi:hypothetical protein